MYQKSWGTLKPKITPKKDPNHSSRRPSNMRCGVSMPSHDSAYTLVRLSLQKQPELTNLLANSSIYKDAVQNAEANL